MSTPSRPPHGRTWPRALVLLLTLLLPVAHPAAALTTPALAVPAESVEYDVLDTALRPPHRASHRSAAPPRPTPAPAVPRPATAALVPPPTAPFPSYGLNHLRTVVLRC